MSVAFDVIFVLKREEKVALSRLGTEYTRKFLDAYGKSEYHIDGMAYFQRMLNKSGWLEFVIEANQA
jgi:hypothetical protein